jgi:hypothetical protein
LGWEPARGDGETAFFEDGLEEGEDVMLDFVGETEVEMWWLCCGRWF